MSRSLHALRSSQCFTFYNFASPFHDVSDTWGNSSYQNVSGDEEKRENTGKSLVYKGRRGAATPGLSLKFVPEGLVEGAPGLLRCPACDGVLQTSVTASETGVPGPSKQGERNKYGRENKKTGERNKGSTVLYSTQGAGASIIS